MLDHNQPILLELIAVLQTATKMFAFVSKYKLV